MVFRKYLNNHIDRTLAPCNYCHHPWCVGHNSYHKALLNGARTGPWPVDTEWLYTVQEIIAWKYFHRVFGFTVESLEKYCITTIDKMFLHASKQFIFTSPLGCQEDFFISSSHHKFFTGKVFNFIMECSLEYYVLLLICIKTGCVHFRTDLVTYTLRTFLILWSVCGWVGRMAKHD